MSVKASMEGYGVDLHGQATAQAFCIRVFPFSSAFSIIFLVSFSRANRFLLLHHYFHHLFVNHFQRLHYSIVAKRLPTYSLDTQLTNNLLRLSATCTNQPAYSCSKLLTASTRSDTTTTQPLKTVSDTWRWSLSFFMLRQILQDLIPTPM